MHRDLWESHERGDSEPRTVDLRDVRALFQGEAYGYMAMASERQASGSSVTTIAVVTGAVLLAVLVCLIFSCFKPSTNYEDYKSEYEQGSLDLL